MKFRKIFSLTLLVSLVPLSVTSVVLYIVPEGRVAYWSDWKMLGLSKSQWGDIHINLGWLFLTAGLFHLYLNWKAIVSYLKNKARELRVFTLEFSISLLLTIFFIGGTLMGIPPLSTILDFGTSFKEAAADKYGEPPYGHAELSSLKTLSKRTGLDLARVEQALNDAGVKFGENGQSLLEIAKLNKLTPKEVWLAAQKAKPAETIGESSFPTQPFPGMGRQKLQDICDTYGLDSEKIVAALGEHGIVAEVSQSIKEIATANNSDPHALFEVLQGVVEQIKQE
ncbi:DUF4405 domain-containing protein [Desulforhopalus sp. 52FAK]